jgi:hypothetical protein
VRGPEALRQGGRGGGKRVLLVLDQAGWHSANGVEVPEGVHLEFLPAIASSELRPAQRLWPLANEAVANRLLLCASRSSKGRCVALLADRGTIRS